MAYRMNDRIQRRRDAALAYRISSRHLTGRRMSVMDPQFNLREAAKQMILLEDHLFHAYKVCPDCIRKHLMTIEALSEEAVTLDKMGIFQQMGESLAEKSRQWLELLTDGANMLDIANQIRQVRKSLVELCFDPRGSRERVASIAIHRMIGCTHQ